MMTILMRRSRGENVLIADGRRALVAVLGGVTWLASG
jgi:hypothetical protein